MSALIVGSFQFMYWSVGTLVSCGYVCIEACGSIAGARRLRVDICVVQSVLSNDGYVAAWVIPREGVKPGDLRFLQIGSAWFVAAAIADIHDV